MIRLVGGVVFARLCGDLHLGARLRRRVSRARGAPRRCAARGARASCPTTRARALYDRARGVAQAPRAAPGSRSARGAASPTVYLGAAAEETGARALLARPPPRLRGEPGRLGALRPGARRPADGRLNTLPIWQRTIADAALEGCVVGLVGDVDRRSPRTSPSASTCSSSTAGTATRGLGRLPGLDAHGGRRRAAAHPRRLRGPAPTAGARPTRSTARRSAERASPRWRRPGACAALRSARAGR